MEYQLRRFQITPGRMADFTAAWLSGVVPLREAAGFSNMGAWADGDEFIWVLGYDGDFESADRAYYASASRHALDPDPAHWIEGVDNRMVDRIL